MNKLQQWVAFTAVAVLAILVGGWFFVVSPRRAHVDDLNTQAAAAQSQLTSLQSQVAMLKAQAKDLPAQRAKIAALSKQIPDDAQLPTLIRQLTATAAKSGVDLVTLAPGPPTPLTTVTTGSTTLPPSAASSPAKPGTTTAPASTGTAATGAAGTAAAPGSTGVAGTAATPGSLMTVPVQITVRGSYFQLEKFLSSLEQLQRRYLVTGYTLTPGATGAGASTSTMTTGNSLDLQLTGMAFEAPGFSTSTATPAGGTSPVPPTTAPASSGTAN